MKLGVLFSGGKDSSYALFKAMQKDKVVCLISVISESEESYMFHTPIDNVEEQARKIRLPLVKVKTKGEKEKELNDLKKAIKIAVEKYKIEGVVTGAVESVYQASRIQKICNELDIYCFNPLWKMNQVELLKEIVKAGFKVKIVKVAADGLDEKWINRIIDEEVLEKLVELSKKYRFNVAAEGGEYESEVVDFPKFK
ncbi:diphthine--ammonia ligase [Candidatus Woesearchaeota archaeon]|nr:diphthine--ammonia ligase [Candidatus Woesearchaeota archaeon]